MFEPGECPCRPDLEALWDGELDNSAREATFRHLQDCADCAAEYRLQEGLASLLREGDPAEVLPVQSARRIRTELLQRASASLVDEEVRPEVGPRKPSGRVRSFCIWSPALAAIWLIAHWLPGWLSLPPVSPPMSQTSPRPKEFKQLTTVPAVPPRPPVTPQPRNNPTRRTPAVVVREWHSRSRS